MLFITLLAGVKCRVHKYPVSCSLLVTKANEHKLSDAGRCTSTWGLKETHTRLTCHSSVYSDKRKLNQRKMIIKGNKSCFVLLVKFSVLSGMP